MVHQKIKKLYHIQGKNIKIMDQMMLKLWKLNIKENIKRNRSERKLIILKGLEKKQTDE